MPKAGGIPEKTSDFNTYLKIVIPFLLENREGLELTEEQMEQLRAEWGIENEQGSAPAFSWNDLYAKKINPVTSTSLVKKLLRAKRLKMDKMLRAIFRWAVYRMSPEERLMTGRKLRTEKNRQIPIVNRAPQQYISRQVHTVITLRFRDPKFPGLRRKPAECNYIMIEYEIESGKRIIKTGFETAGRTIFHLRLDDKFTGKKIRIRSCFSNRRGNGPWSSWLSAIVI